MSIPVRLRFNYKSLCPTCRGIKLLCGRKKCPVIMEYEIYLKNNLSIVGEELHGNSPPSVFIGRIGYPKVWMGPLVPPIVGDTGIYGMQEKWLSLNLPDILKMCSLLIYGRRRVNVDLAAKHDKFYDLMLDLTISKVSPEVELHFDGRPTKYIVYSEDITPFGPVASIKNMRLGTYQIDYKIDKLVGDWDLKAEDAVYKLYNDGFPISTIQRIFSIGALGLKRERRLVPTRWSITAVDDIIGRKLLREVRSNPTISEIYVYEYSALGNKFLILMLPGNWAYEFLEAWFPGTFWNKYSVLPVIYSDYEMFKGRSEYAQIGGCYYSSRLATLEYLRKIGRQAAVIIFREVYSDYLFPVGVWVVRECVRSAYKNKPVKFNELDGALKHIFKRLRIPRTKWIETSEILNMLVRGVDLSNYV